MAASSIALLRRQTQALALTIRQELDIPMSSPVDVYAVIRRMRLWLLFQPLEGLFGMYQRQEDAAGVVVSVKVHPALQRYTAAHELGHHVLGHEAAIDPESNINRWTNLGQQELAAQMFAAEFLMPLAAVNTAASVLGIRTSAINEMGVYQLSLRLRTSYSAMITRLQTLGWFGSDQAKRFRSVQPRELKLQLLGRPLADPQGDVWVVTERQPQAMIEPLVGDEVVFSLAEAPSTGFRWVPQLPEGLAVEHDAFIEPSPADGETRVGGSGRRQLYVAVIEPHNSQARFVLRTPWDSGEEAVAALEVAVRAALRPQPGVDAAQLPALLAI